MAARASFVHYRLVFVVLSSAGFVLNACGKHAAPVDPDTQFTATPNPIPITDGDFHGVTTLRWTTKKTQYAEIHVNAPDGTLFCALRDTGSCTTGKWVTDGMTFYLQNTSAPKPTDRSATLAVVTVNTSK